MSDPNNDNKKSETDQKSPLCQVQMKIPGFELIAQSKNSDRK